MATHHLKVPLGIFKAIEQGEWFFEIENNDDIELQRGDTVVLYEVSSKTGLETGRVITRGIIYQQSGYAVFWMREVPDAG